MTPEELNRTVEFIIASQARLAAAQEQDRQDRIESENKMNRMLEGHDEWMGRLSELQIVQSQRMDRLDKFYQDALGRMDDFQRQALLLLNRILDRLPAAF